MPVLPASVRLALWATLSWQGGLAAEKVLARALPDVDHVAGDLGRLALWHDLGERALFVALPRPGDATRVPHTSPERPGPCRRHRRVRVRRLPRRAARADPDGVRQRRRRRAYGPTGRPTRPSPRPGYRLEMLDLGHIERTLIASLTQHAADSRPSAARPGMPDHRESAEGAVRRSIWGLPSQTPARAVRVITSAARVAALVDRGTGRRGSREARRRTGCQRCPSARAVAAVALRRRRRRSRGGDQCCGHDDRGLATCLVWEP